MNSSFSTGGELGTTEWSMAMRDMRGCGVNSTRNQLSCQVSIFRSDVDAFARSGRAATIEVLDLLQSVSAETDVSVWDIATSFLLDLESLLWEQADEEQQTLRDLAASIIGETYREVGVVTRVNETA